MAITISIGSGKGGAGKSMVTANLALLLAKAGKRVCIIDLDVGGPDIHILYGLFNPKRTLTDFLARRVDSISDVIHTFNTFSNVQLIPGTGDTLQTANMTYQEKQRLLRAMYTIDADVLLIDVGAGTNYHTLDFFMAADMQICVTSPEPTSVMDFYNFLQLATIRQALSGFLSQGEVSNTLKKQHFQTLNDVFALAEQVQPGAKAKAQAALETFNPLLIVNRSGTGTRLNLLKLRELASKYLGIYLPDLGVIPDDSNVLESLKGYLPVCEYSPQSPAAQALLAISQKIEKLIELFLRKRAA